MSKKLLWFVLIASVMFSGGCGGGHEDYFIPEPEENIDNPVDNPIDDPVEEPVDDPVDNPIDEPVEEPVDDPDDDSDDEYKNITYPDGVTEEMLEAEFWTSRVSNPNEVLVALKDIAEMNENILQANTSIVDLESVTELPPAQFDMYSRDLYINGEKIDELATLEVFEANLVDLPELVYCVTVKRANLKSWPIAGFLGYTADDPDDESQLSCLEINSPFVVNQMCQYNGHTFYYGRGEFLAGWVDEKELAICHSKEEWLDSWKVELEGKDFLVVTQDRIRLEPMLLEPEISNVEIMLGARLKLVDSADMPSNIGERTTWFNMVVYLPTRDDEGYFVKKMAMIPAKYDVSIGYLPFTQSNFAKVVLSMIGNRYGWGGMLNSLDASLFVRQIYSCFGLRLPTNTTFQRNISFYRELPEEITAEEKQSLLESLPLGSILYSPGFAMIYMGSYNGTGYYVGDLGVIGDVVIHEGEETIVAKRPYTVTLGPLTMLRRNGVSFFESLMGYTNFSDFVH